MPLQMKRLCFLCIAKIHFVDTDLICLVTAQMSYYSKQLIHLIKNNQFEIYRPIPGVSNGAFPLHGTVRHGSVRYGTVRYGSVRVGLRFHRSLVPL